VISCAVRTPSVVITGGGDAGHDVTHDVTVLEDGDRLQLRCRGAGRPQPTLTWIKDGRTLHSDDTHRIRRTRSAAAEYYCLNHTQLALVLLSKFPAAVECQKTNDVVVWARELSTIPHCLESYKIVLLTRLFTPKSLQLSK